MIQRYVAKWSSGELKRDPEGHLCLYAAVSPLESRVERLEAALLGILESENSTQYGKPKGMHEFDCSSVQGYKRVIPCDCVWGRARLALTNDAGEGA